MYEYFHVKVAANASPMLARYSIDPEYQNIIDRAARGIQVAARVDDQPHAVFGHGREQFLAVSVERLIVIMGVTVKNHTFFSS